MKWILLLFPLLAFAEAPVVLKKNELIICPVSQKPAYRVVETIREGMPVRSKSIVDYDTGKHPKGGSGFKCDSVAIGWPGICINTRHGWKPDVCKKVLRLNPTFQAILVE